MPDKKVHDAQLDADEYTIGSEGGSFPYFHVGDVSENCQMEADASDVHLDSFKKRRTLEPRLWGDGMKLDSRARLKLLDIADDFWDFVSIDWVKPYGIFLTGSICNYNWSKYSDIDLHIVVEFDDVSEKYDFVRDYFNSKKAEWNEKHGGLSIYGYPIEVYVEDVDDETVSNGIYDLEANEWSTKPSMDKVKQIGLDKYAIKERAAKAMTHIDALEDKVRSTNDVAKLSDAADELSAFMNAIRSDRRKGLADIGEFSPSNIVYKVLRRSGYLDKAWSLQDELYDRINSIKESCSGKTRQGGNFMDRKLINEDITCDNDTVNATTKEGDEIYAHYEDADARPFVLFNYEGETVFLLGDYGQWHKEILSDWIMSNIITPILKEWAERELNDCNVQIENAIEELNSDYPREEWEDIDLETLCDCSYYHLCTQALERYIDDALYDEANDIDYYFIHEETMCYEIGEMYDFEYDSNEEDFYIRRGDPKDVILRFLREYTDVGDIYDDLYNCGAISYGRIWDRSRAIGLAYYVDSYDVDETIRFISHESGIPYEDLLTYHIGYSGMHYLVTVKEMIDNDYETDDDYNHAKTPPAIHNMNAKDKWNSEQIQSYLGTKNKKYGDIEAAMRKMGKPDAMAYYNSLKTQESKSLGREIIINEKQLERILTEEVVADGNAEHNPYSKRWKMEREALINYIVNYGQIMTSKENGKEYKVLYDTMLSQYLGLNFCACVQWNQLDMTPGNIVYVRALDKFTPRRFRPQFDTRGRDNMSGTGDDVLPTNEEVRRIGSIIKKMNIRNYLRNILLESGDSRLKDIKNIITEGVETKNMSAAKHYIYNFLGSDDERKAMEIIGGIKHDIPNSRLAKCKFMLGIVRMFLNRELNDASTIGDLDATLKLIASDKHINEFDMNLNGVSCNELIQMFSEEMQEILDAEKKEINNMKFTRASNYDIVRIDSFDEASKYNEYTPWCVTESEGAFDTYTNDGNRQFYFCLKHGFESVPAEVGEGCPLDEYGLSMIAVLVNENGSLAHCTCRWNHSNGGNDSVMDAKQVSKVVGVNFYETFKPNGIWEEKLADAMERLNKGVNPKRVFDECGDFKDGFVRVRLRDKYNFLTADGKFMSDTWFDNCEDFDNGLAHVVLNGKHNFLTTNGNLLSNTWFDFCNIIKNGFSLVRLNGKWNFLTTDGKVLSDTWFNGCFNFEGSFARVGLNNKWNFLTTDGKILSNTWFDFCHDFEDGFAMVGLNGKDNFLATDGKILSDTWFDYCCEFKNGVAIVQLHGKWYNLDANGVINDYSIGESKTTNKNVILTERQFDIFRNLILEGGDSRLKPIKNIIRTAFEGTALNPDAYVTSAEYQVPNRGEQTTWMHYLIYSLRHDFNLMGNSDVPMLKNVAKIAFLELNFEKENQDLTKLNAFKKIINLIKKDENAKVEFIQSTNVTFDTLYEQYSGILQQMDDEERDVVNSKTYENGSRYEIIPINDFETAHEFGEYTGIDGEGLLCYTTGWGTWDNFTNGGNNQCYLCYLPNYKEILPQKGEGYPKDEYGLSMIWLFVDEKGRLSNSNVRWNHGDHTYSNVDNIFTESEISDIVGVNFYETFKPNNKWKETLSDAMERLANGEGPETVFDQFYDFEEGFAIVELNGKENFITTNGKLLSDTWFDNCYDFENGFARVELNNKRNFLTMNGRLLSNTWFDRCYDFENGFARVELNDKQNFLSTDGKILSDTWFDYCYSFENGLARVELNNKYNFLATNGNILSETWFDDCYDFRNGFARVRLNGKRNFLTADGNILSGTWFDYCNNFKNGFAIVALKDKYNFLTANGIVLSDTWFDYCCDFENGFAYVLLNNKGNALTTDGQLLSDTWFDSFGTFKNGFAKVELHGKYNFITTDGKIISDVWFDECSDFHDDGFAIVQLNGKRYNLDRNGTINEYGIWESKRNRKPTLITISDLHKIVKESVRLVLKNAVI